MKSGFLEFLGQSEDLGTLLPVFLQKASQGHVFTINLALSPSGLLLGLHPQC